LGRTATIITVSYLVVAALGVIVAVAVWRSTRTRDRKADPALLARRERTWLWIVAALLTALLFGTIFFTPYGKSAGAGKQVVDVTGVQFAWAIDPPSIRANIPVEFRVRAVDVNHAFAVYNADDVLLFQVQAMPEQLQEVVYTFKKPGLYRVFCLEFCGLDHHRMVTTITVRR
jgi:cytochrome c oxidase subunit 2